MTDPNEIISLKAAVRGALKTGEALAAMRDRIEAIDAHGDITGEDLEELGRLSAAHAIASAALRGLVETMQSRRAASGASS